MKYTKEDKNQMSPMEKIIAKELRSLGIKYAREVIFEGCVNPLTGKNLRYDFYLPELNLLIEYDGAAYHEDPDVRYRDSLKNDFAKSNNIKMFRISGGSEFINKFMEELERINDKAAKKLRDRLNKDNLKPSQPKKEHKEKKFSNTKFTRERLDRSKKIKSGSASLGLVLPLGMTEDEYRTKMEARKKSL